MTIDSLEFEKILSQVPPDYYDSGVKSNLLQKYWHEHKWYNLSKLIDNKKKGTLLDIGCADGTTTREISKLFPKLKIIGVDKYSKAISYAKKQAKSRIIFKVADAHKLPFAKNTFNYVIAVETLEHLHDPDLVLSEIYRVLKKEGVLIIVQDTDSTLFRSVWWFWTKWKGSVWNHSHINCLRPNLLIKKIKSGGFRLIKVKYTNLNMEIFIKAQKK